MNWFKHTEWQKFFKFIIVGVTNTIIMYLLYLLLLHLGAQYLVALTVDYILGICIGFLLNRYWTFRAHAKSSYTFIKYSTSYVGVYLLNIVLLFVFVAGMGFDERFAQIPAVGLVTLASYAVQRFWVFRPT